MEEIKNKRISRDIIKKISKLIKDRSDSLNKYYEQYEIESKNFDDPINDTVKSIVVNSRPKFEISITHNDQTETKSDIDWLFDFLDTKSNQIEKITFFYSGFFCANISNNDYYKGNRSEEGVYITFWCDNATIKFEKQNPSEQFEFLIKNIESMIASAPENYDKTISKKFERKFTPSLSLCLGILLVLGTALYMFCRFSNRDIYINNFVLGKYFVPILFCVSVLLGFFVPGKNHSLYRDLALKKKYAGYSSSKKQSLFVDDVNYFKDNPEIEIGKFYKHGKIRKKIEENFKTANIWCLIFIALFAVFFFLA